MSDKQPRRFIGITFALIGLIIVLTEIGLDIFSSFHHVPFEISRTVLLTAAVIGFIGFYMLDPKSAEDGGGFIVDNAVKVIGVIRTGRRKSDVAAVIDDPSNSIPQASTMPTVKSDPDDHGVK